MIRILLPLVICGFIFLSGTPVHSQEVYPLLQLPTGQVITYQGVQYKAFTLDEYKQIALIYSDYVYYLKDRSTLQQSLTLQLDMAKNNYELQITELKGLVHTYELDRDYWTLRLKEEQEANKRREVLSGLERFGAWALVAVEAVALGALGVAQAVRN